MNFATKVVLVTGANGGIGQALVNKLLEKGVKKVYAAMRHPDNTLFQDQRVQVVQLDITQKASIAAIVGELRDVNVLINNAGVAGFGSVLDSSTSLVKRDMDTNYYGTMNLTREFVPVLKENKEATIVNILTLLVLASMPSLGGYSASKAALASFTQSIRAELGPVGINVVGVYPGAIDTDMIRDVDINKTAPEELAKAVLNGVEDEVEDIFPDAMSLDAYKQWREDPKVLERQFSTF